MGHHGSGSATIGKYAAIIRVGGCSPYYYMTDCIFILTEYVILVNTDSHRPSYCNDREVGAHIGGFPQKKK
jgi:hypothetical protein